MDYKVRQGALQHVQRVNVRNRPVSRFFQGCLALGPFGFSGCVVAHVQRRADNVVFETLNNAGQFVNVRSVRGKHRVSAFLLICLWLGHWSMGSALKWGVLVGWRVSLHPCRVEQNVPWGTPRLNLGSVPCCRRALFLALARLICAPRFRVGFAFCNLPADGAVFLISAGGVKRLLAHCAEFGLFCAHGASLLSIGQNLSGQGSKKICWVQYRLSKI